MLSKEELEHFRKLLVAERERLDEDSASLKSDAGGGTGEENSQREGVPLHPAEKASDAFSTDFAFQRLEGATVEIMQIDQALKKIDEGKFGTCDGCGCEVGIRRLEASPHTPYCLECQKSYEEESF